MPFVIDRRITSTVQGEINSEVGRNVSTDHSLRTETPGIETTTVRNPETTSETVQDAYEASSRSVKTEGPQTSRQTESERTTTNTKGAHEVRTTHLPVQNTSLAAEDAVMEIEFTLTINSLSGCA